MINRDLLASLRKHLAQKEITLLTGARQVGKTTLLKTLHKEQTALGNRFLFFNLDIEQDAFHFRTQEALVAKIRLEWGDAPGIVCIDEIQRKENAGLFLKGLYDSDLPYKWMVSGSGSLELKEKIHESLAGRKRQFELGPVSFPEFVHFRTQYAYNDRLQDFFAVEPAQSFTLLLEYMNFGGYPRTITAPTAEEKRWVLDEIFRSYVEKDLVYLLQIDRPEVFQLLMRLLAAQSGKLINQSTLAQQAGLSLPTLKKYLWFAEKTFSIHLLPPFFRNATKELTKAPQVYFNDIGLQNHALRQTGSLGPLEQTGFAFQQFVFQALHPQARESGFSLHYWRTTDAAEVDFVLDGVTEVVPLEVKYQDLTQPSVSRSLRSFIDRYKPKTAYLVNLSLRQTLDVNGTQVKVIPYTDLFAADFLKS